MMSMILHNKNTISIPIKINSNLLVACNAQPQFRCLQLSFLADLFRAHTALPHWGVFCGFLKGI